VRINHQFSQPEVTVSYLILDLTTNNPLSDTTTTADNPYNKVYNEKYNPQGDDNANKTTPVTITETNFMNLTLDDDFNTVPEEPPVIDVSTDYQTAVKKYTWLPVGWDYNITRFQNAKGEELQFPLDDSFRDRINRYQTSGQTGVIKDSFDGDAEERYTIIDGLTKNHDYLMYLYINSQGNNPSTPQLFFFRTTDSQRPAITIQVNTIPDVGNTNVTINTWDPQSGELTPSNVQYVLLQDNDSLPAELSYNLANDGTGNVSPNTMTYLKALTDYQQRKLPGTNTLIPYGTRFDLYADGSPNSEKADVENLIKGLNRPGSTSGGSGNVPLQLPDGTYTKNVAESLKPGNNYIILVMAWNEGSVDYAFAAATGLRLISSEVPTITANPTVNLHFTDDKKLAYGSIGITLNPEGLYNYNRSSGSGEKTRIVDAAPILVDPMDTDKTRISIHSLVSDSSNMRIRQVPGTKKTDGSIDYTALVGKPITSFTILFGYNTDVEENPVGVDGSTLYQLILQPYSEGAGYDSPGFAVGPNSEARNPQVTITLDLKRTLQTITDDKGNTTTEYVWERPVVTVSPSSWIGWEQ